MSLTPRTDAAEAEARATTMENTNFEGAIADAASIVAYESRRIELELGAARQDISESVDSRNDLIRDLYRSLAWAHRSLGSEPRLVRGQNDNYYREWHAANDLIQQMREATK